MYAVVQTGGKQYQVAEGDMLHVEKLDAKAGDKVVFQNILLVKDGEKAEIGQPYVQGAEVEAQVVDQAKDKKILVFTFKRRKGYHKQQGHRQPFTVVKITRIGKAKA